MKQLKISLAALAMLVAVSFSSCNKDLNAPICEFEQGVLTAESFTTGTRVSGAQDNEWEGNETIGITSDALKAENVAYKTTSKGPTAQFTGSIKVPAGTKATTALTAYYPHVATVNASEATYDLTNQSQPILFAGVSKKQVSYESPVAQFEFAHKLGKIAVKLQSKGFTMDEEKLTKVTFDNVIAEAVLNIKSGELKIDATKPSQTLTLTKNSNNTTDIEYVGYVAPEKAIDRKIVVEYDGKTYSAKTNYAIEAGKKKTFIITISSEDKTLTTDGDNSIAAIEDGGSETIDATPDSGTTPVTPTPTTPTTTITSTSLNGSTLSVPAAGGSFAFNVTDIDTTTDEIVVKVAETWVDATGATVTRAYEDKDFTLTVAANDATSARTASVKVYVNEKATNKTRVEISFTINQNAKDAETATPETTNVNVDAAATSGVIKVTLSDPNIVWDADSNNKDWLTVTVEGETIKYSVTENTTNAQRVGTITVMANDNDATITVTQAAAAQKTIELSVNPTSLTFGAEMAGAQTVTVTTNATSWDATTTADWLTITKNSDNFTVNAGDNVAATTTQSRTATITVTAEGKTATINVTQEGKEITETPTPAGNALYPNGMSNSVVDGKNHSGYIHEFLPTAGKNGGEAIKLTGGNSSNAYVLDFMVPANMPANPTKITFWVKGSIQGGKSIALLKMDASQGTNYGFSALNVPGDGSALVYKSNLSYVGTFKASDWTQIILDLSSADGSFDNLSEGTLLLNLKIGKGDSTDILISDFEIF